METTIHTLAAERDLTLRDNLVLKTKACLVNRLLIAYSVITGLILSLILCAVIIVRMNIDIGDLRCYYNASVEMNVKRKLK